MRFRNSLYVTIDNFVNVFKLLLYRLMIGGIVFSLVYALLTLNLRGIVESEETSSLVRLVKDFLSAIAGGDTEYLHGFNDLFQEALKAFLLLLKSNIGTIVWSCIGLVFLYLLSRFANGLAVFAVGNAVNERMRTCAHAKFSAAYFMNLGRAALYQVIYVPASFVYDALSLLVCYFFFFYALSFLPLILTISLAVTAYVCLLALKLTVISAWMPSVIADGAGVARAFGRCFRNGKNFGRRFAGYLVAVYLIIITNVITAVCTFGSGLFLSVSLSYLFVLCMQFVNYCEDEGKKYFVSAQKVVDAEHKSEVLGE